MAKDEVAIKDKDFNRFTLPSEDVVSAQTQPNVDFLNGMKADGLNMIDVGNS